MQATRPLFSIVLLLSCVLCGPVFAEYPFPPQPGGGAYPPPSGPLMPGDPFAGGGGFGEGGYGGGYDVVPYGDGPLVDEYAPEGELYDSPYPQEDLFGFESAYWPGWVSGNLTPGTDRFLYGGELFLPLYQDGRTLWYFDFRGQGDDNSASEFNTGTGVRVLSDPGWIFGAYAFWDHLNSSRGNTFNQGMIGVEAMSVLWDARMNIYFPESGTKFAGPASVGVSNGNIVIRNGIERAYWGMDFEVGNLLWAWGPQAQQEVRGFLALYHFDHSAPNTNSITGPRARLEYRHYDLPYFGPGSRFSCGLTAQWDEVRDGQLFAFARLRIPLDPWAHKRKPLSPLHRRMLDRVVRDVDIVTGTTRQNERALNPITGHEIRGFARIDADTQNIGQVLGELDSDSVILVDGSAGVINATPGHQLKPGQTVIGAGTPFSLTGATTGRTAMYNPGGERPTLDFGRSDGVHADPDTISAPFADHGSAYAGITGLKMADHTQLIGVDMQNVGVGVGVHYADDVLIKDVGISEFSVAGIDIGKSTNVKLDEVHVRDAWLNQGYFPAIPEFYPPGSGIRIVSSQRVDVENSHIENTQWEGIVIGSSQDVAIRHTTIRDTLHEGIRAYHTTNLLIEDVELKNTGGWNIHPQTHTAHAYSGIWLRETDHTLIRDSRIHSPAGAGILGNEATATVVHNVHIAGVDNGIIFRDSQDLAITGSHITAPGTVLPAGIGRTADQVLISQNGIQLDDPSGEVLIKGNQITGGPAGAGLLISARDVSTNLRIEENTIAMPDGGPGMFLFSQRNHDLQASITGNTVDSPDAAFRLTATNANADPNGTRYVTITDNQWNGEFYTSVTAKARVDMTARGNHLGGDPMGRFEVASYGWLKIQYRDNTSNPGAGMMEFENKGGTIFYEAGTLSGNDHQPDLINFPVLFVDPAP